MLVGKSDRNRIVTYWRVVRNVKVYWWRPIHCGSKTV